MNGFTAPFGGAPPASPWQEHHTPDGRAYFYNSATKVTQWTKPEEMMTPTERALADQPWKEYTAEGGKKYWYNTETKQSSWEMPDAYRNALGSQESRGSFAAPPSYGQGQNQSQSQPHGQSHHRQGYRDRGAREPRDSLPDSRQLARAFVPATDSGPEYATKAEAAAAFTKALKRSGVQPDWTWEQALVAIAKDPLFRALKSPAARKVAFAKFCEDAIAQEQERAKDRLAKLRADFETMLKRHPDITHSSRWKSARPMIEGETIFRSTDDENERHQLFYEYVAQLKEAHIARQKTERAAALDGLTELLSKLGITAYTRWSEGQEMVSAATHGHAKYQALTMFDTLTRFQDHIKSLERDLNEKKQMDKKSKYRRDRQHRDAFKALLADYRRDGRIKAGTTWKSICRSFENDDRYRNMLGQAGSTPLELFWDVLAEEERALRGPRNDVLDVLEDKKFAIAANTTLDEFMSVMKDDRRTARIDPSTLQLIFERLREKRAAKREDERHSERRQQRHAVDALRLFMKRLDPPIMLGDTYEQALPRLAKSSEFRAVASDEAARHAFDRHMHRLREKADDGHEHRAHRRNSHAKLDPYEADRRRAVAERERNHRKSTMAESVLSSDRGRLSPPPRPDRDYERHGHSRRSEEGHHARDRREREDERERPYRRSVDTRSIDELNYGDERPAGSTSSRRRRPDDEGHSRRDSRDSKRLKTEKAQEPAPQRDVPQRNKTTLAAPKATQDARSGSEEGEIEE
ncbi:hypothetical protein RJ55_01485 [Drechmeria coniospora]|nr:hypothetical protein RJ55_01485 [Drechmeria coniospora]